MKTSKEIDILQCFKYWKNLVSAMNMSNQSSVNFQYPLDVALPQKRQSPTVATVWQNVIEMNWKTFDYTLQPRLIAM